MKYLGCDLQTVVLSVYTLGWATRWDGVTPPLTEELRAPDEGGLSAQGGLLVAADDGEGLFVPFRRRVQLREDLPLWDALRATLRPILSSMIARQEGALLRELFGGVVVRNVILVDHTIDAQRDGLALLHPYGLAVDYEHLSNTGKVLEGYMTHLAWDLDPTDPSQVLAGVGGRALTPAESATWTAGVGKVLNGISERLGERLATELGLSYQ